ncbi:SprB repeat-containing protein [Pararhizobium sp. A13]|uniref:SprB repeat-containing protein n=1 Tax=Pararhizobium sp. A13 TaxID=3133975 RepID=UPI00311AE1AA
MDVLIDHFPVFEANQVLSSRHLNDVFDYLDQQTRWTRSHLIGIGIVCGLEIKLDTTAGPAILLSRGCGVTSEGYLIVEPDDVSLVSYRTYTTPTDLKYPQFAGYPLWELFPSGEPSTTQLDSPSNFLADKAVVLFLELKKEGLRNCSPNSCDDRGSEITTTVRRLLIESKNLDAIIAAAEGFGEGLTSTDIDKALSDRLNLPDIRLRRFDVLNSNPVTSDDLYAAFLRIFRSPGLATAMGEALSAAYAAFKQVLKPAHPTDPFAGFAARFDFLDVGLTDPAQVHFLQYYVDLFDDLVRAYDEFRWKGAELICACCPPEGLFPRHLMLGLVNPDPASQPGHYRQRFLASPVVGRCTAETEELLQLFARLVEMTECFTSAPVLPNVDAQGSVDPQIRITPSTLGDRPLATRAIPYYYAETGTPPLYRLWNGEKTRRNRANQNLAYRSDEYSPVAPNFVVDPLRYDLEPYNFLRIEGHLGKPYLPVMSTLIALKSNYRLPIDIIALHTGAYDESQPVDLGSNDAIFQDLEALYDALREDLLSSLAEAAMQLYEFPTNSEATISGIPTLPLLKQYRPTFQYTRGTLGAGFEKHIVYFRTRVYLDLDQNGLNELSVTQALFELFRHVNRNDIPARYHFQTAIVYYISSLADVVPDRLAALSQPTFLNRYQDLLAFLRYFRMVVGDIPVPELGEYAFAEHFIDLCDTILFGDKLEAINSVRDEYLRRIAELRKRQVLANFLAQHPGIQHKAGVPVGGTFIVVYHGDAGRDITPAGTRIRAATILAEATRDATHERLDPTDIEVVGRGRVPGVATPPSDELLEAITRIGSNQALVGNADVELLIGSLTGKIPLGGYRPRPGVDDGSTQVIAKTVSALPEGVVIADFYLPYRVSGGGLAVNHVLPKEQPVFTVGMGCTVADGEGEAVADVSVEVRGGVAPYELAVNDRQYRALANPLSLPPGRHKLRVRDADGAEAAEQEITVAERLVLGEPDYKCSGGNFTAEVVIRGGTPPYRVGSELVTGATFTSKPAPSGSTVQIEVTDGHGCSARIELTHECVVVPPPTFTAAVACTGQNDRAPVTIAVQGGTAPYQIKVDSGAFLALVSPLSLAVGQHSLKVRDSAGIETAAQPVTIATQISITELEFHCKDDGTYTATFDISGGTRPYVVNGISSPGGAFTTDPTSSGKPANVVVVDSRGCSSRAQVVHECQPPCNLPCRGVFIRRGHRFWMPDPGTITKYLRFEVTALSFQVSTEEGDVMELGNEIQPILQVTSMAQLTTGRFPGTVRKWLKQINELIATKPELSQPNGIQLLETSFDPAQPGRLGRLWIDHFDCLPFKIEIDVFTQYRHPNGDNTIEEKKKFIYTPDGGTQIIVDEQEIIRIPPFEGQTWNKCPPVSGPTPICAQPEIRLEITPEQDGRFLHASVTADPPQQLIFLWEVQDADPALGHLDTFDTNFIHDGQKRVTVTAYAPDGCDVSETIFVDVRG